MTPIPSATVWPAGRCGRLSRETERRRPGRVRSVRVLPVRGQAEAGSGVTLDWSEDSGWSVRREAPRGGEDVRWLGAGLAPDPRRVAQFVDSIRMDFETCGSVERPYYRSLTEDRRDLLTRLSGHLGGTQGTAADAREVFEINKKLTYLRRAMDDLLTADEDPIVSVPLRRSEARALATVLDYAEDGYASAVVAALRCDLVARMDAGPAGADRARTARDQALRLREQERPPSTDH